jgi:hypothetical protein
MIVGFIKADNEIDAMKQKKELLENSKVIRKFYYDLDSLANDASTVEKVITLSLENIKDSNFLSKISREIRIRAITDQIELSVAELLFIMVEEFEREEFGWKTHAVFPDGKINPNKVNFHTHGILEKFGHLDFQVVIPLKPELVHGIFWDLVDQIISGKKFEEDKEYAGIIKNYNVMFRNFCEGDRNVLRLIFPDENGLYPFEQGCNLAFSVQMKE